MGSVDVEVLGITTDNELKFDKNVLQIYSKASRKLCVLARIQSSLHLRKRYLKLFLNNSFNYVSWLLYNQ